MKIRTRLTLWYAAILAVSTLLIGVLSYRHFVEEHQQHREGVQLKAFFQEEIEGWSDLSALLLWCGIPAALLGLVGGSFLMRRALAPISQLTRATEKIHEGNLHERIPRSGNGDELDRLTEVFNDMIARLDHSFGRIREFTLHASHELKTPLTVLRGEMETGLREETLPEAQRQRLLSQVEEIDRLTKIVEGLTLLTKADAGQITLNREPLQLDRLLRETLEDAAILATPHRIQVNLCRCHPVTVLGDRHRLRQLLLNLLDNAIKYNHPGGSVSVELQGTGREAALKIINTGHEIPAEKLPRVFERFFRCDESHNNAVEGCGLGLSIAQWIVTAHGGSIQIHSQPATTTVSIRLPLE